MRPPNQVEVQAIRDALTEEMGGSLDWEPEWDYCGVIDNYISDGPSWTGKAAIFVGGEICFITLAMFDDNGRVKLSSEEFTA